jgi:hypothetical protein
MRCLGDVFSGGHCAKIGKLVRNLLNGGPDTHVVLGPETCNSCCRHLSYYYQHFDISTIPAYYYHHYYHHQQN